MSDPENQPPSQPGSQPGPAAAGNGQEAADQPTPQLRIVSQFTKDLSFENPGAPESLAQQAGSPNIGVQVDVRVNRMNDSDFEVELHLSVDAKRDNQPMFVVELLYAGIFRLANIPADSLQPVVLIECPRQLFPFARRIIADATRDGGFPPLMIDPIDFATLYRQRIAQAQAEQAATGQPSA